MPDYWDQFAPAANNNEDYWNQFEPANNNDYWGQFEESKPEPEQSWLDWGVTTGLRTAFPVAGSILGGIGGAAFGGVGAIPGTMAGGAAGSAIGETAAQWYEGKGYNPWAIGVEAGLGAIPIMGGKMPGLGSSLKEVGAYALRGAAEGGLISGAGSVPRSIAQTGQLPSWQEAGSQALGGAAFGGLTAGALGTGNVVREHYTPRLQKIADADYGPAISGDLFGADDVPINRSRADLPPIGSTGQFDTKPFQTDIAGTPSASIQVEPSIYQTLHQMLERAPTAAELEAAQARSVQPGESTGNVAQFGPKPESTGIPPVSEWPVTTTRTSSNTDTPEFLAYQYRQLARLQDMVDNPELTLEGTPRYSLPIRERTRMDLEQKKADIAAQEARMGLDKSLVDMTGGRERMPAHNQGDSAWEDSLEDNIFTGPSGVVQGGRSNPDLFSDTQARQIVDRAFPPPTPEPQPATEYGQSAIDQEALQWMRGQDEIIRQNQEQNGPIMGPVNPDFQPEIPFNQRTVGRARRALRDTVPTDTTPAIEPNPRYPERPFEVQDYQQFLPELYSVRTDEGGTGSSDTNRALIRLREELGREPTPEELENAVYPEDANPWPGPTMENPNPTNSARSNRSSEQLPQYETITEIMEAYRRGELSDQEYLIAVQEQQNRLWDAPQREPTPQIPYFRSMAEIMTEYGNGAMTRQEYEAAINDYQERERNRGARDRTRLQGRAAPPDPDGILTTAISEIDASNDAIDVESMSRMYDDDIPAFRHDGDHARANLLQYLSDYAFDRGSRLRDEEYRNSPPPAVDSLTDFWDEIPNQSDDIDNTRIANHARDDIDASTTMAEAIEQERYWEGRAREVQDSNPVQYRTYRDLARYASDRADYIRTNGTMNDSYSDLAPPYSDSYDEVPESMSRMRHRANAARVRRDREFEESQFTTSPLPVYATSGRQQTLPGMESQPPRVIKEGYAPPDAETTAIIKELEKAQPKIPNLKKQRWWDQKIAVSQATLDAFDKAIATVPAHDLSKSISHAYARSVLMGIRDGEPGITLESYGNVNFTNRNVDIIYRGPNGKGVAKATVEISPNGDIGIPSLASDKESGLYGRAVVAIARELVKLNAFKPNGSYSLHTKNFMKSIRDFVVVDESISDNTPESKALGETIKNITKEAPEAIGEELDAITEAVQEAQHAAQVLESPVTVREVTDRIIERQAENRRLRIEKGEILGGTPDDNGSGTTVGSIFGGLGAAAKNFSKNAGWGQGGQTAGTNESGIGAKYSQAANPAGISKADGLMRAGQATKDPRLKQLAGKAYEEEAGKITLAFLKDYGINELHRLYNDESGVLVIPSWKNIKHFAGWGQGRNSPAVQRAQYTWVDEVLSLPKNMTTIADMSFPFRQGLGAINTPQFWQAVHKMFGGLTPTGYDKINADILNLPAFRPGPIDPKTGLPTPSFADKIGFNLHSTPSKPGTRAQGIASRWLETGGSVPYLSATYRNTPVAMWFRASNRANVTFMNHLRANRLQFLLNRAQDLSLQAQRTGEARPNIFKQKYDLSTQAGVDAAKALDPYRNMQLAREIADAVNTFTGQAPLRSHILPFRGAEVNLEQSARALGRVFFSPGLAASRFRTLNPSTYIMATPQVRQQYLISALGTAMGWIGALGLMKMYFGDEMEIGTDPTSADFGKAVIGNYRVDPGASNQQFMVLAARLATGQYTSSATGKTRNIGEGFQARTAFDQGLDFTANKLEPMSKLAVDMARATGYQPVHVYDRTMQMFTPLIAQDIWELSQKRPDLLPMSVPAFFGMGTQIYDRGASESKFIRQADDWTYQGGGLQGLLMGTNYKGPGGQTSGRTYGTRKSATQQTYGTRRQ